MERGDRTDTPENLQLCDTKANVQSVSETNTVNQQNPLFKDGFDINYYAEKSEKRKKDSINKKLKLSDSLEYVEDYYKNETSHETQNSLKDKDSQEDLEETKLENDQKSSGLHTKNAQSQSDGKLNEKSHDKPRFHHWSGDWSQSRSHDQKSPQSSDESRDPIRLRHYSADAVPDSRRILLSESSSLMMGVTQLETVQVNMIQRTC